MHEKVGFDPPHNVRAERKVVWWHLSVPYPYLKALAIYLCSRLVVFLGVEFGNTYIPLGNDTWFAGSQWYRRLLRWDSEWY
jgi:hypothetical protein